MHYHQTFNLALVYSSTSSKATKERPVLMRTRGKKRTQEKSRKKRMKTEDQRGVYRWAIHTDHSGLVDAGQIGYRSGLLDRGATWLIASLTPSSLFSILVWAPCPESYWPVTKIADCTVKMRGFFKRESMTFVSLPNSLCYVTFLWSHSFSFKSQLQFLIIGKLRAIISYLQDECKRDVESGWEHVPRGWAAGIPHS